ncbi:helicase-related protein [Cohnella sp. CFH 77786]|uniref:helicase-related protein n=1 Tax=Cohnella sp. CFH 77786 TaxID=2662265 RepID=UPI001C60CAE8|nr:helicase-related protein [Cohnella sp. CFH 77786]
MKVTEIPIVVTLEPSLETEYLGLLNEYFAAAERNSRVSSIEAKKRLMAIKDVMTELCNRNPNKLERLNEVIGKVRDKREKLAIISKSAAAAAELHERLTAAWSQESVLFLSAELSVHQANQLIDQFNKHPDSTVLILTDAASTGLDVTAANHLVHYDYPSRYLDMLQRHNRMTRQTSQHREAWVYYLMTSGKIDEFDYGECMAERSIRQRANPTA